jgi:hypothetical protein
VQQVFANRAGLAAVVLWATVGGGLIGIAVRAPEDLGGASNYVDH